MVPLRTPSLQSFLPLPGKVPCVIQPAVFGVFLCPSLPWARDRARAGNQERQCLPSKHYIQQKRQSCRTAAQGHREALQGFGKAFKEQKGCKRTRWLISHRKVRKRREKTIDSSCQAPSWLFYRHEVIYPLSVNLMGEFFSQFKV